MNTVREIQRINALELSQGVPDELSWHSQYKSSAWIYFGGLPYDFSEEKILVMFSQWGEIEEVHLIRDEQTNKSKGFGFLKYEDYRSTVLAVDNFNGTEIDGRVVRVDHKLNYERPKSTHVPGK
jgi:RNA-binding motif protein, X-linked 2